MIRIMAGKWHNSTSVARGHTLPPLPVFGFHQDSDGHALHAPVLVLNASYEPINVCAARRAIVLVLKGVAMTEEEKHIRESVKQLKIPCFQTSLHERTAFSHMFRFKVAIDELSSRETNGLEAALENADNYANEVVATLRGARQKGSAA